MEDWKTRRPFLMARRSRATLFAQSTADARIDSPPTANGGLLLFGCTDGHVCELVEVNEMETGTQPLHDKRLEH